MIDISLNLRLMKLKMHNIVIQLSLINIFEVSLMKKTKCILFFLMKFKELRQSKKNFANTFKSIKNINIGEKTIAKYLNYFVDAFILNKSYHYDIKGKKYIDTLLKYYFTDVGLRNARLNFRQQEENHIMENIIYNELLIREFDVDVGVSETFSKNEKGKTQRISLDVDFVANKDSRRYYIQSTLS